MIVNLSTDEWVSNWICEKYLDPFHEFCVINRDSKKDLNSETRRLGVEFFTQQGYNSYLIDNQFCMEIPDKDAVFLILKFG